MRNRRIPVLMMILAVTAIGAAQTVPMTINYQGRLTDNSPQQTPVSGSVSMAFAIYDAIAGGTPLWSETWPSVAVVNGVFSVLLGSSGSPIPTSVFTGGATRYLEVAAGGEVLSPRQLLGSVGFAHQAESAATVTDGVYTTGAYDDPAWINALAGSKITGSVASAATAGSATSFTGALSGDVTGTQGATTVGAIRGTPVSATPPASNQVLLFAGGQWQPGSPTMTETDPKVGTLTAGRVPRWGGTALDDGAIYDDGAGHIGVGTTHPQSTVHLQGSIGVQVNRVNADTSLTATDYELWVSGNVLVTLPPASGATVGRIYVVLNEGSGLVQVRAAGTDLLNGMAGGVFLLGGGQEARIIGSGVIHWLAAK